MENQQRSETYSGGGVPTNDQEKVMDRIALELKQISFHYLKADKQEPLLDSLDFKVKDGEFISIIGTSGSGKTTLFRLITGLEEPVNGGIYINGECLSDRLGSVGYMPQQDLLMPWRTILKNAVLPLELKGISSKTADKQAHELLKEFGLGGYENEYPRELSGGMKQRLSFLRAVLSGSNILLLDEPFSALDAMTKQSMQEWLLGQWGKRKQTILFITHDINEALFLSDRIFILTEKPVRTLKEFIVPLDRPRKLSYLNKHAVIKMKEEIMAQFQIEATI